MKRFLIISGFAVGAMVLLLIGFVALMIHVGMYIADPVFPRSYSVLSSDGKYLFVMLGLKAPDEEGARISDKALKETRLLQAKYPASGLYLNDGSTSPLWLLESASVRSYGYRVFVSSDGHHLAKTGWWTNATTDEAVTFYKDGKILASYSVRDVATASWFLPGGHGHYDWDREITFDDDRKTLTVVTNHYDKLVIDMTTGKITSAFRPVLLAGILLSGLIAYLIFKFYQKLRSQK